MVRATTCDATWVPLLEYDWSWDMTYTYSGYQVILGVPVPTVAIDPSSGVPGCGHGTFWGQGDVPQGEWQIPTWSGRWPWRAQVNFNF